MSDINKTVASKTHQSKTKNVEYTMKEILESNRNVRRIDRINGREERPIEVWNNFDELLLCDRTRFSSVKKPKNIPLSVTGEVHKQVNNDDDEVNNTKDSSTETKYKNNEVIIKKDASMLSSSSVNELHDDDQNNESNDQNKDIKVFVGKNVITDDEYMSIEDLLNLGWI